MAEISTLYADVNGSKTPLTIVDERIENGVEWIDGNEYIRLTEGQDLNTVVNNGTYVAPSDAIAQSILNKPSAINSKFKLIVSDTIGNTYEDGVYKRQEIISHNSNLIFTRISPQSGVGWKNWDRYLTAGEFDSLSFYTSFSGLGVASKCTTLDLYKAMPNNSILFLGTDTTSGVTDLPATSGVLKIIKMSSYRYEITFFKSSGGDVPALKGFWLGTTNTALDQLTWQQVNME